MPAAVFLVAAALLRDAGGGFTSGVATLAMLPVFWVALHGSRAGLALVILGVGAFLAVPVLAIGGPDYPASGIEDRRALRGRLGAHGRHRSAPRRRDVRAPSYGANARSCSSSSSSSPRPIP